MTADEKLNFLDSMISKIDPSKKDFFYALYIALGDDLFLVFSVLSGLSFTWPDTKAFRSAQIQVESASQRRVAGVTRSGVVKTVTVPHVMRYLDITAMQNTTFVHMDTHEITPPRELQKFENYYCEELDQVIYPLTGVRDILGREWILITEELKPIEIPQKTTRLSDDLEDFFE
jgi:hypothetical protein